jgi:hypothetical protein
MSVTTLGFAVHVFDAACHARLSHRLSRYDRPSRMERHKERDMPFPLLFESWRRQPPASAIGRISCTARAGGLFR